MVKQKASGCVTQAVFSLPMSVKECVQTLYLNPVIGGFKACKGIFQHFEKYEKFDTTLMSVR